jgi:hypothetical protein
MYYANAHSSHERESQHFRTLEAASHERSMKATRGGWWIKGREVEASGHSVAWNIHQWAGTDKEIVILYV